MKRYGISLLCLALIGCRGPRQFSAPAPPGALDCALREAEEVGYRRLDGRREAGVVRLGRHIPPPPGREPTDPELRLSDVTGPRLPQGQFESQIRISVRRGQLRIAVLSEPEPDAATRRAGAGDATGDAQQILVECSTPPAALPLPPQR